MTTIIKEKDIVNLRGSWKDTGEVGEGRRRSGSHVRTALMYKMNKYGTEEMVQLVRAPVALPEDQRSIQHPQGSSQSSITLVPGNLPPSGHCLHMVHRLTCKQNTHTH